MILYKNHTLLRPFKNNTPIKLTNVPNNKMYNAILLLLNIWNWIVSAVRVREIKTPNGKISPIDYEIPNKIPSIENVMTFLSLNI